MSLAVVPPHRAPSIDPALRAFLAECLDGVGVDGDVGDVPSREVPDLPRELSFDDANGHGHGASPRPNAYVPTDEKSLGVPRPYGKFAPFKPTDVAGNLRHYRKPTTASTIE